MTFFTVSKNGLSYFATKALTRRKLFLAALAVGSLYAVPYGVQAIDGASSTPPIAETTANQASSNEATISGQSSNITVSASSSSPEDSTNSTNTSNSTDMSVVVNGESVPVPENGTVTKTITSDTGNTSVDVKVTNQSTDTSSKSKIKIKSSSRNSQNVSSHSTQQVTNEGELQP